jgi:hypothetical protein
VDEVNRFDRVLILIGYLGLVIVFGLSIAHTNNELEEADRDRCATQQAWTDAIIVAISTLDADVPDDRIQRAIDELQASTDVVCDD